MLVCATRASKPCSSNSRMQKARAKKPRSSPRGSMSTTKAPARGVEVNRMRRHRLCFAEPIDRTHWHYHRPSDRAYWHSSICLLCNGCFRMPLDPSQVATDAVSRHQIPKVLDATEPYTFEVFSIEPHSFVGLI